MVSILRNTGHGKKDRINHSYAFGGIGIARAISAHFLKQTLLEQKNISKRLT